MSRSTVEKVDAAIEMVINLCKPKGTVGSREWMMSIPARPQSDPDLVIGDALFSAKRDLGKMNNKIGSIRAAILDLQDDYRHDTPIHESLQYILDNIVNKTGE